MRRSHVLLAFIAIVFFILNTEWAFAEDAKTQGQPLQYLQQQIDQLKEQIAAIRSTSSSMGKPGTACWDSNQNGECDLSTEDINADGKCDVQDCQAPSRTAVIRVYDSSESPQFLGIAVDIYPDFFVPGLSSFASISADGDIFPTNSSATNLYYESADCSGDAFIPYRGAHILTRIGGEYYLGMEVAPTFRYFSSYNNGFCYRVSYQCDSVPVQVVPKEAIPFTLPVVLPLKYVLE
jgi:hypothetical protein